MRCVSSPLSVNNSNSIQSLLKWRREGGRREKCLRLQGHFEMSAAERERESPICKMQREHEGVSEWARGGDKGGTGIIWTPAKQTFIIFIWMNGADWSSDSSLSRNAHQCLEDLHDRHTSQLHCEYKHHISLRARGPPHSWVMKMWQSPNLSLWLSSRNIRLAHWHIHHQLRHNGLVPLVIVTLEPRAFKVHKSWGGLDIRPPQYFIHTMSFNQDQSSAKEHMGPTDAALIPLGFFFLSSSGSALRPLSPGLLRCPVAHKHEFILCTHRPAQSWF